MYSNSSTHILLCYSNTFCNAQRANALHLTFNGQKDHIWWKIAYQIHRKKFVPNRYDTNAMIILSYVSDH